MPKRDPAQMSHQYSLEWVWRVDSPPKLSTLTSWVASKMARWVPSPGPKILLSSMDRSFCL